MNRIDAHLSELKAKGEKALITFITAGDPSLAVSEELVLTMFDSGADVIEIGVPFSDPIAEGQVIQEASLRSMSTGETNLNSVFELIKRLRRKTDKPLVLLMYINTIFRYGTEKFFGLCKEYGVDGVIIPDMPYEERMEVLPYADANEIVSISMVTPTSHERIEKIASSAKGFLYCVSSTGVTGTRNEFATDFDSYFFGEVKKYCPIPAMVGFGISSPEMAKKMSKYCDGVIVGSAIVKIVAEYGADSVQKVGEFTKALKEAMK